MENKFIILITAYNDEKWVEYNIASILNQTYSNYQVMYYNDASTDDTFLKVVDIVGENKKFTLTTRKENKGTLYSCIDCISKLDNEDILVCMSGDDWLFDDNVLQNLNNYYNKNDVWMTYGKFYCWDNNGDGVVEANPQNTLHPDFIHDNKYYRRDTWRASHLRTFKGFLAKKLEKNIFKSNLDSKYYDHAADLAMSFPCLEMCGKDKIGVIDFPSYVYNVAPSQQSRTIDREQNPNNKLYELEIRNRKIHKEGLSGDKFPQINVIGYFQETNYIPKEFTFVYNQEQGEFDATLITDMDLLPYLKGEKKLPSGIIIADLHESSTYSPVQSEVHNLIKEKYQMFDLILTYDKDLLELPNSKLRFCMWRCLNKNVHTNEWPILADHSLYKLYNKTKNLSCISSNKSFLEGHKKRLEFVDHAIATTPKDKLNMFGVGFNEIKGKIVGLEDYRFSIAIENENKDNWATEKISDCFLTGVIPIYYGCPNIGDYFDIDGIITFQTKDELEKIIKDITLNGEQIYKDKYKSVKNNFELVNKYSLNIDQIFNQYIKHLI
jgi:glycosyltransferase involved in cell wall biosynthesis